MLHLQGSVLNSSVRTQYKKRHISYFKKAKQMINTDTAIRHANNLLYK